MVPQWPKRRDPCKANPRRVGNVDSGTLEAQGGVRGPCFTGSRGVCRSGRAPSAGGPERLPGSSRCKTTPHSLLRKGRDTPGGDRSTGYSAAPLVPMDRRAGPSGLN